MSVFFQIYDFVQKWDISTGSKFVFVTRAIFHIVHDIPVTLPSNHKNDLSVTMLGFSAQE